MNLTTTVRTLATGSALAVPLALTGCEEKRYEYPSHLEVSCNNGLGVDAHIDLLQVTVSSMAEASSTSPVRVTGITLDFFLRGDYEILIVDDVRNTLPVRRFVTVGDEKVPVQVAFSSEELEHFDAGGTIFVTTSEGGLPRSGFMRF